jgi:protein-tyrosine phosphatase
MIETGPPRPPVLAGACNFRDLGGLPTEDGRRTRAGVVFRSDSLADLDEPDAAALCGPLRIGRVIDLRTPEEVAGDSVRVLEHSPVQVVNLPVRLPALEDDGPNLLVRRYFGYLSLSPDSVVAVLDLLSQVGAPPTVVHCTSGKDRTGVVTALVLRLVGVTEDAVVGDYVASAPNVPRLLDRLGRTLPPAILRADESTMRTFLSRLESRYGGARGWARRHGVADGTILRLDEALVEPSRSEVT